MARSISLDHLLSVVHSETSMDGRPLEILDVGCGNGQLMAFLQRQLSEYRPGVSIRVHGFDVSDPGVQERGFMDETRAYLAAEVPGVDWSDRLRLLTATESWPYPDGSFDWVVSNHVLEHVADHEFVLREVKRVLKPGGKSVHLFPIRDNVLEGHIHIPCAHWIRDHDRLRGYIRAMTHFGIGNYRAQQREDPTLDIEQFAETRADYITYFTNYVTRARVLELAKQIGLRCTFRYTEHFTFAKIRQVLRQPPAHQVSPVRIPLVRALLLFVLARLTSVTALLEKEQSYRR